MSKKPSQIVQVKVRMREDLRRKIEHAAQKNGLTVNAEILRRLDQTFDVTLDKLEGSVAKLSRFEESIEDLVRVRIEQARREMLQARREELQARRGELQRRLTEAESRLPTEAERHLIEAEGRLLTEAERRLTEAGEKDQGDQS
jgi:hypothetical protein